MAKTRLICVGLVAALAAALTYVPASARPPAEGFTPPRATQVKPVPVRAVPAAPTPKRAEVRPGAALPAPRWPDAGTVDIALPSTERGAVAKGLAGTLPVAVSPPEPAAGGRAASVIPERVRVSVLDQAAARAAGVNGVLLRVARADRARQGGQVEVTVDYSAFATAYGADWASRLRLVELPACARPEAGPQRCLGKVLPSRNDVANRTVTASVPVPAQAAGSPDSTADASGTFTLLALAAGSSGAAGSFAATSLSPSATWSAGGSSGDFTWSYGMRNPPSLGGPSPEMKLFYSAQSVDGRHAASNNQPSWVGEGFEFTPGDFIERRYRSCAQDMDGADHNNSTKTGDLCWETNNATMSLGGAGGELIYDAGDGFWHLRRDDGTKAERIVGGSSYGNGDNDGEYWKVTTADGTQYYFGRHKLDGWTSGAAVTDSTWTVPVFGNDPGEPCHASSFTASDCAQAWRWNLDYVVDPNGNTMSFWYAKETNKYARNNTESDLASYVRGGYLTRVDYGTDNRTLVNGVHTDSLYRGVAAPMRVAFTPADRCLSSCTTHDAAHWPDTPWDQECTTDSCLVGSPTFWSAKRLSAVTTQVRDGSAYRNVERWTLTHTFPDPGDGTRAGLFLQKISHEGLVGTTTTVPDIEFTGVQLSNRVDVIGDPSPAMNWWRLAMIRSETGGTVSVNYSAPDCVAGSRMPTSPSDNTLRCYPVRWTPEGYQDPITDYFHKYVVTTIYEADQTGGVPPNGSPRTVYSYSYLGDPAWHYADDDGLIGKKEKTWSVWRGYARVSVTVGDPGEQTYAETTYFRGMHGDKLPTGTRSVTVTGAGVPTVNDEDAYAGLERERITFNGPGGPEVSREVSEPWQSAPTASRTINGDTVAARHVDVSAKHHRVVLDAGRGVRVTSQYTSFDGYGYPVQVDDRGDTAVTGDEQCIKTSYGHNTSDWLLGLAQTINTYAVACSAADPSTLTDQQVVSVKRISYDGNDPGVTPAKGNVTRNEEMSAWASGVPSFVTVSQAAYDAYGRVTDNWDAVNAHSTTAYTPASGGPVTQMVATNPMGHTTTSDLEPAWGLAVATSDANAKRTDMTYDGLGRLTATWKPGRVKGTDSANLTYSYLIRADAPSVITTEALNPAGNYVTSYELYDGLLRPRQTQAASPSGGRLISDTFYDTAGREVTTFGAYHTTGTPGTTLVTATERALVPTQTRTVYDGAGRVVASIFQPYDAERYRTRTYYAGDRVDVTPPAGGTPTSKVGDARGNTVELRQYHGTTPTGTYDRTQYKYDAKEQLEQVIDPAGNRWTFTYDIRGRQDSVDDPDKGLTKMTFDNEGRITSVTDARNTKLVHVYDPLGRKRFTYENQVGGPLRASWIYDTLAKGKLSQSTRMMGSAAYRVKITGYTDNYQPTGTEVVIPTSETGLSGTYNFTNYYNVDGSAASASFSETGDLPLETVYHRYDAVTGLPKQMTTLYGTDPESSYVSDTVYNALGQIDQYTFYTGLYSQTGSRFYRSFTRELETGRVLSIRADRDSVAPYTLSDVRYTYDDAGKITKISDVAATGGTDNQCFRHDHLGQLVEAWTPGDGDCTMAPTVSGLDGPAKYWLTWTLDVAGNRIKEVDHGTPSGDRTTTYTVPTAGSSQPHAVTGTTTTVGTGSPTTYTYTYDEAGNTRTRPTPTAGTQTLTWDLEGRLSTSTDTTGTTTYIYDADGNRLIRRDPTGKTLYLPGQELRYTTATGNLNCTRYYTFNGETVASRTSAGLVWLSSDHQGTAQLSVRASDQQATVRRQTPYGTSRGTPPPAWPNTKGFVGGTVDNTGLTHLGAREYDPALGRFVSVDPVFNMDDPTQMNGYSYAGNSPVTQSDPTGRESGGSWMYIGSDRWSVTKGGYRYHFRADYFLYCRYGGAVCLGGYGGQVGWINMAYAGYPGVWLVARVDVHVWRVALNFIGPVAAPPKPKVYIPQTPACPTMPPPPEPKGELDGPKCAFKDFKCLFSGKEGAKKWWRGNRDWVTGSVGVAATALCIVATAGVCAVAGAVGLTVALGGRVADVASSESGWTGDNVARMGMGMAIDIGSTVVPGVRSFKYTRSGATVYAPMRARSLRSWRNPTDEYSLTWREQFKPNGQWDRGAVEGAVGATGAQVAWFGVSAPGGIAPWQNDIPFTDPFKWGPPATN